MTAPRIAAPVITLMTVALISAFAFQPNNDLADTTQNQPAGEVAIAADPFAGEQTPAKVDVTATAGGAVQLQPIGQFAAPVEVIEGPDNGRTYVVQQGGQLVRDDGHLVLDVSDRVLSDGERGLLGAAFHPEQPYLYVHYSNLDGDTVIAEFHIDPDTGVVDASSHRVVLLVAQPYENHNGGELTFGPDAMLYLGLGDGGLADDPIRSALDLTSPLGKILRINPLATNDEAYTVPTDNPFVERVDADPTIWSYGLRNPWKFSFDSLTGDLWVADVGQNQWEEINHVTASAGLDAGRGVSFGWSAFEGEARFNADQPTDGHTAPVLTYERDNGRCSISGGAVYRGSALPELDGWFIYGDYCTGTIWGFDTEVEPARRSIVELAQTEALAAIATGGDGELYAVSIAGTVSRLV